MEGLLYLKKGGIMILSLKEIGEIVFFAISDDNVLAMTFDFESFGEEIVTNNPQWFIKNSRGDITATAMFLSFVKGD